jgi:hypothetical protein
MLSPRSYAAEEYRHQVRVKTRDRNARQDRPGHNVGGVVYGYRNISVGDHREQDIIPEQAEIIRRIFREIAGGRGSPGSRRDSTPLPRSHCHDGTPGRSGGCQGVGAPG